VIICHSTTKNDSTACIMYMSLEWVWSHETTVGVVSDMTVGVVTRNYMFSKCSHMLILWVWSHITICVVMWSSGCGHTSYSGCGLSI